MANHYNVARLPTKLAAQKGAAIGVAFISAVLSLGISLGVNFEKTIKGPQGPNLPQILQKVGRDNIPEDIQFECIDGIAVEERPTHGDWIAIWGGWSLHLSSKNMKLI